MEEQIIRIFCEIMEVRPEEVSEDSSPDTMVNWDSLKHMSLILALEETFDIRFDEEAILSMLTLKEIILKVAEYTRTEQSLPCRLCA